MWVGPGGAVGDEGAEEATTPRRRRRGRRRLPRSASACVRNALVALDQLSIAISPATSPGVPRRSTPTASKAMLLPENAAIRSPPLALAARGAAAELGPSAMDVDAGAAPPPADERTMALNAEAAKRFITAALDT